MVRASGADGASLVLDLGAGTGAITAALRAAGARVVAIERDAGLAARLRRRFQGDERVRIVQADLREVPLPRRGFLVVANLPFATTTAACRRLLGDPEVPLQRAELIVQWGAARWLSSPVPRDPETAWWAARYEIRLAERVGAGSFVPPPSVEAARVSVRPRSPVLSSGGEYQLRALLRAAAAGREAPVARLPQVTRAVLSAARIDPRTPAGSLTGWQWHRLAHLAAHRDRRGNATA